jgi:hypothetical protein
MESSSFARSQAALATHREALETAKELKHSVSGMNDLFDKFLGSKKPSANSEKPLEDDELQKISQPMNLEDAVNVVSAQKEELRNLRTDIDVLKMAIQESERTLHLTVASLKSLHDRELSNLKEEMDEKEHKAKEAYEALQISTHSDKLTSLDHLVDLKLKPTCNQTPSLLTLFRGWHSHTQHELEALHKIQWWQHKMNFYEIKVAKAEVKNGKLKKKCKQVRIGLVDFFDDSLEISEKYLALWLMETRRSKQEKQLEYERDIFNQEQARLKYDLECVMKAYAASGHQFKRLNTYLERATTANNELKKTLRYMRSSPTNNNNSQEIEIPDSSEISFPDDMVHPDSPVMKNQDDTESLDLSQIVFSSDNLAFDDNNDPQPNKIKLGLKIQWRS